MPMGYMLESKQIPIFFKFVILEIRLYILEYYTNHINYYTTCICINQNNKFVILEKLQKCNFCSFRINWTFSNNMTYINTEYLYLGAKLEK